MLESLLQEKGLKMYVTHMGQIPQDGNFGENVAYFFLKVEPSCVLT